jgi:hypothetical protein
MNDSIHVRKGRFVLCAAGSFVTGALFLLSLAFTVPQYLKMRTFGSIDGSVVMYSHDQYAELLQNFRILFFVLFPLLGIGLVFTAWMIRAAAKCFSEASDGTPI